MTFEEVFSLLDAAIFAKTQKHLKNVERFALGAAWQGQTYDEMAMASNYLYTPSYLKQGVGLKLCKLISAPTSDAFVQSFESYACLPRPSELVDVVHKLTFHLCSIV